MVTKQAVKQELEEVLGISLFFFICFVVFQLFKYITLSNYDISYYSFGSALVGALIIAKVVFLLDKVRMINRMDKNVAMVGMIFKSFVYLIGFVLFTLVEHLAKGLFHGESFGSAISHAFRELLTVEFLGSCAMLFIVFILFNGFWVIRNHLGPSEFYRLFFARQR